MKTNSEKGACCEKCREHHNKPLKEQEYFLGCDCHMTPVGLAGKGLLQKATWIVDDIICNWAPETKEDVERQREEHIKRVMEVLAQAREEGRLEERAKWNNDY